MDPLKDCRVTVSIPHLDTPESLEMAVALWRLQGVKVYLQIVDTGSNDHNCDRVRRLCGSDCEMHELRPGTAVHPHDWIAAACDLSLGTAWTTYLLYTHTDVFPRRRDLLSTWIRDCTPGQPVVGYGMSDRGWETHEWVHCVGHSCLMVHAPTLRQRGITWSLARYRDRHGPQASYGWPDTESGFGLLLWEQQVNIKRVGQEINHARYVDQWIDHPRSLTCTRHNSTSDAERQRVLRDYHQALTEAHTRLAAWQAEGEVDRERRRRQS